MPYTVGCIVGSLSKHSINRVLTDALAKLAPSELIFADIPIADLPLYNHDLDPDYPQVARDLKSAIESCDALLFATPEYNRSIPGPLKNAIDFATRPWGSNSLDGKPAAIVGASVGPISTAVAQQHLKTILSFANMSVLGQPEVYVRFDESVFTSDGDVADPSTEEFLSEFLTTFHNHIAKQIG